LPEHRGDNAGSNGVAPWHSTAQHSTAQHSWIIAGLAIVLTAGCGQVKTSTAVPSETYDAGAVFYETTPEVVHTFTMINPTDRVVQVKEVKRSCTCTVATVNRKTIPPGESVDLTMKVTSQPIDRQWDAVGALEVDDPVNPFWTCHLRFRTHPPAQFEKATINLGTVKMARGGAVSQPTTQTTWFDVFEPASVQDGHRPAATAFDLGVPAFLAVERESEPQVELIDGGVVRRLRYPIRVGLRLSAVSELPSGTQAATISAKTTAGGNTSIAVAWNTRTPIIVAPSSVSFGIVRDVGTRESRKFVILASDDRPFRVLSVAADSGDAVAGPNLAAEPKQTATRHTVEIAYQRSPSAPKYQAGQVVVQTDHPEMPTLRLPWSAIAP